MFLNDDIVDIDKPDRICLLTFVADEFFLLNMQSFLLNIQNLQITNCFLSDF